MNYPIYPRRIWAAKARKEQPTPDYMAHVLDPTVAMRATAKNMKPRYKPAPLKPFENILNPPPPKKAKRAKAEKTKAS